MSGSSLCGVLTFGLLLSLALPAARAGQNAARAGELIVERPTPISLGFEWRIEGDANGNASARVLYRRAGAGEWREHLPLFRIGMGAKVPHGMMANWPLYAVPDAVAGSIMDLEPGTEYEVRLELTDPDGVSGDTVKELTLSTRAEPTVPDASEATEVRHVYPPDSTGEKETPHYLNIMHAVNGYRPLCDVYMTVHPNAAPPGTLIKVHPGVHTYDRHKYWDFENRRPQPNYWLHGTITLVASGTAAKPIYIVGVGDGEVIIDGDGAHTLFNLRSADHLHFGNLTIRNTDIAFHGGWQGLRGGGTRGLTVKNCWIEGVVYGILAQDGASKDFYIADNVILGRNNPDRIKPFGRSKAGYAVNIAGQGHAVCHNYVAHFWDGINVFTGSLSDPATGQHSRAIDFYNNEIHNCRDQFIETDGGYANIRILRNRMFNCPSQPVSVQPVHAGPVYWIRNVLWNAHGGRLMMKTDKGTQAYVFLHNTSSTHMTMPTNVDWSGEQTAWLIRNNISIGPAGRPNWPVVQYGERLVPERQVVSHNAFHREADGPWAVGWGDSRVEHASLEELREATEYEEGSLLVDYGVFVHGPEPADHARPGTAFVWPHQVDLRLRQDSAPVDAGVPIPGVNDDFTGTAPDMGAYERDRPLPVYGPRGGPYLERLRSLQADEQSSTP